MLVTRPENKILVEKILHVRGLLEQVQASDLLPEEQPTGRYIYRGKVIDPFKIVTPLIEYGPEDVEYLLYAGIIKKEMTVTVWFMEEQQFPLKSNYLYIDEQVMVAGADLERGDMFYVRDGFAMPAIPKSVLRPTSS